MVDRSPARRTFQVFNYIFLMIVCIVCILPFINLLAVSFSAGSAASAGLVNFWPVDFTLKSYEFALTGDKFVRALLVSVERVLLGVTINLVLMILTAYPLSKEKTQVKGRNIYVTYFVITMLINGGMIPTYLVVVKTGIINTIWSLVLPGALPVYNMIILMNFLRGLPPELEEAGIIDGTSPFGSLWYIILPLMKPALATVLQSFEQIMQSTTTSNYAELLSRMSARTGRAAQLFLGALPVMLCYPFLQKYFTTGLVLGSVKG
jgi:putative aldouronate transport system permease protein